MCTARLVKASTPPAAMNAVNASPTGITAATTAPKTASRISSVNGIDSSSARWKSLPSVSLSALSALASPASSTRSDGFCCCTLATASSTGCTRSPAVSASPFMSNVTSIERPSFETNCPPWASSGECTSVTAPVVSTAATTCATAARSAASSGLPFFVCTSTFSAAGLSKPAFCKTCSALAVWPSEFSASVSCLVPRAPPMTTAMTTNSSQPMIAVLR